MTDHDEVEELLALGHESRSFEIKGPGNLSDGAYCAKIARAVMAMGNLRDGGLVCLGIDEARMTQMLPGLDDVQLVEWSSFDDVSDKLARYSDPPVSFRVQPFELSNGKKVVVIDVAEFDHVPHVCGRDYQRELQKGMTYVRPRGKPESVPVPSSLEMRELLDLATTKAVREFVARASGAGISLDGRESAAEAEQKAFHEEAVQAWGQPSEALQKIMDSGHTDVAIRPGPFNAQRIAPARLHPFIEEQAVRLRGWPVPYTDHRIPVERYGAWIGQTIVPQIVPHFEAWRMCSSGQFLHRRVLATDMRDSAQLEPSDERATGAVAVWDVLFYLVEITELGARMATALECETVTFDVVLNGVAGRQLISGDWDRELHASYLMKADRLQATQSVGRAELLSKPREVGVNIAQEILGQFGAQLPEQVLMDWQEKVLAGR